MAAREHVGQVNDMALCESMAMGEKLLRSIGWWCKVTASLSLTDYTEHKDAAHPLSLRITFWGHHLQVAQRSHTVDSVCHGEGDGKWWNMPAYLFLASPIHQAMSLPTPAHCPAPGTIQRYCGYVPI